MKKINYEDIIEPENFNIITSSDGLIIDNEEDWKALVKSLKNVKVDKKLSRFFNKILTEFECD